MERITSFTINHNLLEPGFYISRVDGDITTYDLRTRKPNVGDYMSNAAMHSVEHMVATYIRNSEYGDRVIYFGPMGCQTGFYLLMRDVEPMAVFELVKSVLLCVVNHEGVVFGASAMECGHYENLSLPLAQEECGRYLRVLEAQTDLTFAYSE